MSGFPRPVIPPGIISGSGVFDIYADIVNGNNGNPGSESYPVQTLEQAIIVTGAGLGGGGKGGRIRLAGSALGLIDQQGSSPVVGSGPLQTYVVTTNARIDIPAGTILEGGGHNPSSSSGKAHTWIRGQNSADALIRPGLFAGIEQVAVTNRSVTGSGIEVVNPGVNIIRAYAQGCGRHGLMVDTNGVDTFKDFGSWYTGNAGCGVYEFADAPAEPPQAVTYESIKAQGNQYQQWLFDSRAALDLKSVGGKGRTYIDCIAQAPGGWASAPYALIERRGAIDEQWERTYIETTSGGTSDALVRITRGGVMGISAIALVSGTTYRYTMNPTFGTHYLNNGDSVVITNATPAGYNGTYTVTNAQSTTVDLDIGSNPAAYNPATTIAVAFGATTRFSRNVVFWGARLHGDATLGAFYVDYAQNCKILDPECDVTYVPTTAQPLCTLTANSSGCTVVIGKQATLSPHPTPAEMVQDAGTGNLVLTWNDALSCYTGTLNGQPMRATGATSATRYVGATASGAPVSGAFLVGDFIIDRSGSLWICTAAGSPGTWTQVVASRATKVITRDTLANRPAAGTADRLFYASDVAGGQAFVDTGSAWLPLAPSNAVELATTTTFNGTSQAAGTDVTLWAPWTIPANFLAVGTTIEIILGLDNDIISSGTARNLVYKLKLGATTLVTGTQVVTTSVGWTNQGAFLRLLIACYATGASGVLKAQGALEIQAAATGANLKTGVPFSSAVGGTTIDTTAAQAITITVNESANSVADLVRAETGRLTIVGA